MAAYDRSMMIDEEGNVRRAMGGLADAIWGAGVESQNNMRRRQNYFNLDPRRQAISGIPHADPGALRTAGFKGYSGIMRGMANAARAQGRDFEIDLDTWGNTKDFDVPTGRSYSREAGQVAPGMRGRPSEAMAKLTGANPDKAGYYTPDEFAQARLGLQRAFRGLR